MGVDAFNTVAAADDEQLAAEEAAAARRRKRVEIGLTLSSGLTGLISLALFATNRHKMAYTLGITSGVVGTVVAMIRIAEE